MSAVKELAENLVMVLDMVKEEERKSPRFSVALDYIDSRRLEYIALKLGQSKSGLASQMLVAAIYDFEVELGIALKDVPSELPAIEQDAYHKYITMLYSDTPLTKELLNNE